MLHEIDFFGTYSQVLAREWLGYLNQWVYKLDYCNPLSSNQHSNYHNTPLQKQGSRFPLIKVLSALTCVVKALFFPWKTKIKKKEWYDWSNVIIIYKYG